jgi:hypothetical protein
MGSIVTLQRLKLLGVMTYQKKKVAWSDVCFPKKGGLGLKNLEVWNKSSILRNIWHLFACAGSFWVAWTKTYLLKGRSF